MIRITVEQENICGEYDLSPKFDEFVVQRGDLYSDACSDDIVGIMKDILSAMGYHPNSIADSFRGIADEIAPEDK